MAYDAELDRIKAAQESAFSRKQSMDAKQQAAWEKKTATGEVMNRAFEEKQRVYRVQEKSWQNLMCLRNSEGPRIEELKAQQERASKSAASAFDNAASAHARHDKAAAASYAAQAEASKAEAQSCANEQRAITSRLNEATDQHKALKPAFDQVKNVFNAAKRDYDQDKAIHEQTQVEFKKAKADFDNTVRAFKNRLEALKTSAGRRNEGKRMIAEKLGVPDQYLDNTHMSIGPLDTVNIHFGGIGKPNGPGCGHYAMNSSGEFTHKREPFIPNDETITE